jgi:transglutaminase-like putative cysteine protease
MFGHQATLRAFPPISYRFLRQCADLTRYSGKCGVTSCIPRLRSHFEGEFQESVSNETSCRIRNALRVPATDSYDHGAGDTLHPRLHIVVPDHLTTSPSVPITPYRDMFGNWCSRIVAPAGHMRLAGDGVINDSGLPDPVFATAAQHPIEDLPSDTLVYLLGSRYCETDRLSDISWKLFENTPPGWLRVQAICDFVHHHIAFGYEHARATKTAWEAYSEGKGVCRDYAHLAITFCRCMNIPARYCTGYLSDIGTPLPWAAGDFAGWLEAYIGGRWHMFDPRNNVPESAAC